MIQYGYGLWKKFNIETPQSVCSYLKKKKKTEILRNFIYSRWKAQTKFLSFLRPQISQKSKDPLPRKGKQTHRILPTVSGCLWTHLQPLRGPQIKNPCLHLFASRIEEFGDLPILIIIFCLLKAFNVLLIDSA